VNRRAEAEIQGLARKLNLIGEKVDDIEEMVRQRPMPANHREPEPVG
jgi:hypothetical protein